MANGYLFHFNFLEFRKTLTPERHTSWFESSTGTKLKAPFMDIQYKRNQLLSRFSKESLKFTVLEESKGRTNDIDELTEEELSSIFFMLFPSKRIITPERRLLNLEEEKKIRHLRSIILSDAQYIGLYKPNNWTDFNAFMLKKSILKKPLNNYKINEFANLIKQFKAMKSKYDSNKFIPGTKEWYEFIGFRPSLN